MSDATERTLTVRLEDEPRVISISQTAIQDAEPVLKKMDADMDKGWQMSRRFVTSPTNIQRCQIAADKILTALHHDNKAMVSLMSAYIMTRLPTCATVEPDVEGSIGDTVFYDSNNDVIRSA